MDKQNVILYLIHNQEYFKKLLVPFNTYRDKLLNEQNEVFKDDIKKQYDNIRKFIIATEVTKRLAMDYETVIITLEEVNLDEFLKL